MESLGYKTLTYRFRAPVAVITLDRPRASNRVNLAMATELRQVCQRTHEEDGARVAIITGRGKAFSSGREPLSYRSRAGNRFTAAEWLELHRAASVLAAVEIPVIAAINGDAIDHGLELALACDLRIAARGARLGLTDVSRGVVPWDGGTQRLPRLAGRALALELLLTSRLMDSEEAFRTGLVNSLVEPGDLMTCAEQVALAIASGAPLAARYAKEAVHGGMDMTLEYGLRQEADLNIILQSTRDRDEGLRSFFEGREPNFKGE